MTYNNKKSILGAKNGTCKLQEIKQKYHVVLDSYMNPNYKNYHIFFNKILNIKLKDNASSIDNPNLAVNDY